MQYRDREKKLKAFSLNIKIQNYWNNWLQYLQIMEDYPYLNKPENTIHKEIKFFKDQ